MAPERTDPTSGDRSPSANPASRRWGDLPVRVASAAVLAPVAIGCIWWGGIPFTALIALITIGLSFEWLGMCQQRGSGIFLLFAALPLAVIATAGGAAAYGLVLLTVATAVAAFVGGGISIARPAAFGIPYFGLAAVALVWLRQSATEGASNVIVLLLVVWASDIGAYIAGRAIGGAKLAPSISPGKTRSGAIGGLVAAAAVGLCDGILWHPATLPWRPLVFASLIGIVSQMGDLFESLLKRRFGVKDSGALIPGHGGLLDRLDGVLTAAPTAALLALTLGPGVVLWE